MPRVFTTKAAKDYPSLGIKKGENYFRWKVRTRAAGGVEYKSKTYPRPSQLNFGFTGKIGDIELDMGKCESIEDLRGYAEQIRELGEECGESFDNMPEGLQQGDTGQLLEERRDGCEGWADEVESACDEAETKLEEFDAQVEAYQTWLSTEKADYDTARQEFDDLSDEEQAAAQEPDEPDEPDEPELPEGLDGGDMSDEARIAEARSEIIAEAVSTASEANPGL